ncbi:MAG TPA: hypothetical protein VLJ62_05775 [Burkholderiaceae bacterium]|nr:hypothetical protein [Burkholderiaceae bacterium]
MSIETLVQQLSLAVRMVDHFSGQAVADELPLRLSGSLQRPVLRPGGGGRRQADGAYRFVNAPAGPTRLMWCEPFARGHAGWTRWADDPLFVLPLADAAALVDIDLWPTANAAASPSVTGVRGRLTGSGAAGQTVRIAVQGEPFVRFTRSDDQGEFLFVPPGRMSLDAQGRVPLTLDVSAPDGTPRIVAGGSMVPASAGAAFAGADFTVLPRLISRVIFQLA